MKKYLTGLQGFIFISIWLTIAACSSSAPTYDTNNQGSVKDKVEARQFIFVAESVTPQGGQNRFLTSPYDVSVRKDSLVAYLPYFGRSTTTMNNREGGIKFTSTNFGIDVTQPKFNHWVMVLTPGDQREVRQLIFSIFNNGQATLQVTSTFRDPIAFEGRIK